MTKRRKLDFTEAEQVIDDIEMLRRNGYQKTKAWNLSQVCFHLNETMKGGMDGFGFRLPWILRATVVKWGFRYSLKKRSLMSGAPTFPILKPAPAEKDSDDVIDECIATLRKAAEFKGPMDDYALLDNLSVEDWQQFMWIHAAHHLGFLIPNPA